MDVKLAGITQSFGKVRALDSVCFTATSGAIHAIVGENGAGKTTLMRVLYGAQKPESGSIEIAGRVVHFRNSKDAISSGIGMVSQHYSIIPELTCLQNLMLGAEPGWFVNPSVAEKRAFDLAAQMGYAFEWNSLAETLSPAGKQKLEILKLLWREARVMILDEPTAMLSPGDSDALFESLRKLATDGATIIVVTHRLPEVIDHCKTVTVLRGGKSIDSKLVTETDSNQLAELIVGHAVETTSNSKPDIGPVRLQLQSLTVRGYRGDDALDNANLEIHSGEIVGLAGVDGNGQRELFQALVGRTKARKGKILFDGIEWSSLGPRQRIACGLRLIPEDRHAEGVVDDWSLIENAALGLQRLKPFASGSWVNVEARRDAALRIADRFQTKHGGIRHPMRSLSGGNQQRFVVARALDGDPSLILAFQPTRGLDIDGTAQVYAALRAACLKGASAFVVCFDLDELLANCDRVVAISHGKIQSPRPGEERDRQAIGRLMVGAA